MAYTKYSLTPANNTAAPPDGAPEGMLPSAVNDTMRDMMAQIRDCGDGIRDGTYTMTAPKITGGTITGSTINNSAIGGTTAAAGAFTTLSATGATTFSGATVVSASLTANTFSSSGATITGGTINSTAIGGSTASTGKFTTLEATGVTTVQAGTVSLPAITTTGDTNTGIFFPAADTIAFTEGGAEAMRINSSGNVGIGTSSPAVKLDFGDTSVGTQLINLRKNGNSVIGIGVNAGYGVRLAGPSDADSPVSMGTISTSDGSTFTERMRITSGGNLLVATTTVRNSGIVSVDFNGNTAGALGLNDTASANGGVYAGFLSGGTFRGSITNNNNTAVAYNTTSDYRLKENIAPMTGALATVAQLKPVTYKWKADGSEGQGFIAHELQEIVSDCVTGEKDAVDEEGNPKYQGVDTSFLVATLTAAIQELKAIVDTQATKIAELEAKL